MRHLNTISRVFAGVTTVAVLGACSGSPAVQVDGSDVVNAEESLTAADDMFTNHLTDVGADGAVTSSDDSRCYYLPDGESDDIATEIVCGPVRVLDVDDSHWLPLPVSVSTGSDGVTLDLSDTTFGEITSVDTEQLFRPDGEEPVAVDSLPDPEAPEAPVSDFAVMPAADDTMLEAEFEAISEPYVLRTPSMTVTVEETAEVSQLTTDVVDLAGGGAGDAGTGDDTDTEGADRLTPSYFRPANGQTVRAWRLSVSAPVGVGGDPEADWLSTPPEEERHDPSGTITVTAGSEEVDVIGGPRTEDGSAGISCNSVPCQSEEDNGEYVLVTSSSSEEAAELVVTTDGTEQTLNLDDGTVTSAVSTVADSREQLAAEVSASWETQSVTLAGQEQLNEELTDWAWIGDLTFTFGGTIEAAHLTPFDSARGWAAEGKAWLVVPVVDDPRKLAAGEMNLTTGGPGTLSLDESVWTLQAGDQTVPGEVTFPQGNDNAGLPQRVVFEVDDTYTQGTITYHPTGSVDFDNGVSYPLETESLTAEVTMPE